MTTPSKLSGYTSQSPMDQQRVTYANPIMWIKETISDGTRAFSAQSGTYIENQLTVVNTCAQEILNSVGVGRAVDTHGEIIDYRTQIDELINLASDVLTLQQSIRDAVKNDQELTRYAHSFPSKRTAKARLLAECNRSINLVQKMTAAAGSIHSQAVSNTKALTSKLLDTVLSLPKDCLGIIAQYSIL